VSDDFTWKPVPASRRMTVRVAVVLVFAGLGVAAGSLYPISLVITAFERATLPRVSRGGNETLPAVQEASRAPLSPIPTSQVAQPISAELKESPSEAARGVVLLNPGTTGHGVAADEQPTKTPPGKRHDSGESKHQAAGTNMSAGDRNVLVVVRSRVPPYDTKVLRGRIQDGRLIVNARDRRGITLR
jgi:hypothetical protein